MSGGIYKIENSLDGKCYVGSAKNFERRKSEHFKQLHASTHGNKRLLNAVLKHGIENFDFIVIETLGEYVKEEYFAKEDYWISKLNSKVNGYNIADARGGDMTSHHPRNKELRELNSKLRTEHYASLTKEERSKIYGRKGKDHHGYGKPRSQETLRKMHESMSGENHWFYGKKLTKDHVAKIADANRGKTRSQETKALLSSQKTGSGNPMAKAVIVGNKEYPTITAASIDLDMDRRVIRRRIDSPKFIEYYFKQNNNSCELD